MLSLLAAVLIVALITWWCGSLVARLAGVLLIFEGLLRLAGHSFGPWSLRSAVISLSLGIGLWLIGHWIFARKYRRWRSSLAYYSFRLPVLRVMTPLAH